MCGIAGIAGDRRESTVAQMLKCIRHRGPDDSGTYVSSAGYDGGVTLGNVRLSILDLSSAGHQPMSNEDGSVWVVYNGEIFNFPELRAELEADGHVLKSHTDTEILPHLYEKYGCEMVSRLNGMFALALWDCNVRKLFIVRDRMGIKPLYYTQVGGCLYFASEVKALLTAEEVRAELDPVALQQYLAFLYVPNPSTLFKGIRKLEPGHSLSWQNGGISVSCYSDTKPAGYLQLSKREMIAELRSILVRAVKRQLLSDVPVGFFLSGGLDSSTILACASKAGAGPLRCYTIAFSAEDGNLEQSDEDPQYARRIAKQFGAEYHEIKPAADVVELLPKVTWHLDDAVADPAAIATYLISDAARSDVTVLMSGQGGDEVFGGYRAHLMPKLAAWLRNVPTPVRRRFAGKLLDAAAATGQRFGLRTGTVIVYSRYLQRLIAMADLSDRDRYIRARSYVHGEDLMGLISDDLRPSLTSSGYASRFEEHFEKVVRHDFVEQMLYLDCHTLLPDLNLTYSDKLSMARSIEVRVPLLDNEVVDFLLRVPPQMKIRRLTQKWLLKEAMLPWLPTEIIRRPKTGFGLPVRSWIRGKLREMVGDLLSESAVRRRGLLNPIAVNRVVQQNQRGERDNTHLVWILLTLELWMRTFIDQSVAVPPSDSLVLQ